MLFCLQNKVTPVEEFKLEQSFVNDKNALRSRPSSSSNIAQTFRAQGDSSSREQTSRESARQNVYSNPAFDDATAEPPLTPPHAPPANGNVPAANGHVQSHEGES